MPIQSSPISRRDFLKTGGVLTLALFGGGLYRAASQGVFSAGEGPAYEPWEHWQSAATAQERLVAAGILASNPHNSQPWYFRVTDSTIDLYADTSRQIGTIDPFLREMTIGLGCVVENMALAARAEGFEPSITLASDSQDSTHMAHLQLAPSTVAVSDDYKAIPLRHTNRTPYDVSRAIPSETLQTLEALLDDGNLRLFWYVSPAERRVFGEQTIAATAALIADEQQSSDSHRWWRQSWADLQKYRDGITLDAQGLSPMITVSAKMLPDFSRPENDQTFLQNTKDIFVATANGFGLLAARAGQDPLQRLQAGRAWQRIHLWTTLNGMAVQPLNQICERADRERQLGIEPVFGNALRALMLENGWEGIMPFRLGYPTILTPPSPRRSLDMIIRA